MFDNGITDNNLDNNITILSESKDYKYPLYNDIISNIDPSKRYDHYYIINTDMAFYDLQNNPALERNYIDVLNNTVDRVIADNRITLHLQSGKAMLLFDFSVEYCPVSTDDSTIYGKINKHFSKIDCHSNVMYWTMFENVYDKIDKKDCKVRIECVSISAMRYVRFNYNTHKKLIYSNKNELECKPALYLNRRPRNHRVRLLAECIRQNIDIDNMHFSFIGSSLSDYDKKKDIESIKNILSTYYTGDETYLFENIYKHLGKSVGINTDGKIRLGPSDDVVVERVSNMLDYRAKSKFEIITEYTYTDDSISISEKLSLAILSKIPFVVIGDRHYLQHLKKLGFKTFDEFWSEEYDHKNEGDRLSALATTIKDITDSFYCRVDEYNNTIYSEKMNEILEHNYSHYKDVYSTNVFNRIVKSLSVKDNTTIDKENIAQGNINTLTAKMTLHKLMTTHFDRFKESYPEIAGCKELISFHEDGLEESMNEEHWRNDVRMLDGVGFSHELNPAILDLGTQFGLFPHFLNSIGMTDVSYTNSEKEASVDITDLQLVWNKLQPSADGTQLPIPLHVSPREHFTLPKKYDIITCTTSNILWKTDKVLRFHDHTLYPGYYVMDKDDKSHSFFTPYNVSDLRFFIENIKEYLNDDGVAIIQPYPFPYHIDVFKEELELLRGYQLPKDGYVGIPNGTKNNELYDYFIIRK